VISGCTIATVSGRRGEVGDTAPGNAIFLPAPPTVGGRSVIMGGVRQQNAEKHARGGNLVCLIARTTYLHTAPRLYPYLSGPVLPFFHHRTTPRRCWPRRPSAPVSSAGAAGLTWAERTVGRSFAISPYSPVCRSLATCAGFFSLSPFSIRRPCAASTFLAGCTRLLHATAPVVLLWRRTRRYTCAHCNAACATFRRNIASSQIAASFLALLPGSHNAPTPHTTPPTGTGPYAWRTIRAWAILPGDDVLAHTTVFACHSPPYLVACSAQHTSGTWFGLVTRLRIRAAYRRTAAGPIPQTRGCPRHPPHWLDVTVRLWAPPSYAPVGVARFLY